MIGIIITTAFLIALAGIVVLALRSRCEMIDTDERDEWDD